MWPQPGMKAEKRPASPPMTKRWMFSALGTIGMRESSSRLYQTLHAAPVLTADLEQRVGDLP